MNLPANTYRYYIFYLKDGLAIWVEDFFDERKANAKARLLTKKNRNKALCPKNG